MAKSKRTTRRKSTDSTIHNLYVIVRHSFVGKIAVYAMVGAVLLLVAILASRNQFDLFFKITGIGLLVVTVVSWLTYLLTKE